MKILMVLTSHDRLGETGHPTGFWLEEFVVPYYRFQEAGAEVHLASPKGGLPPMDPKSLAPEFETEATQRYLEDTALQAALKTTTPLASVDGSAFDAVFYPGGHGPVWDLAENPDSIRLIEQFWATGKPIGSVCHGPAVLRHARRPDGDYLVKDRSVTCFSNTEEAAIGLTEVVPYLLEDELVAKGGHYQRAPDWQGFVAVDDHLITGQNPASSLPAADALLLALQG